MRKLNTDEHSRIWGTTFHGVIIRTTKDKLVAAFGEPSRLDIDKKTKYEWYLETNKRNAVCIYDFKEESFADNAEIDWHIGGFSRDAEEDALEEIKAALPEFEK